jgi:hypothetical protein
VVHLQANHSYNLVLRQVTPGNGWQWHYLYTSPSQAGFEGQFALSSYEQSESDTASNITTRKVNMDWINIPFFIKYHIFIRQAINKEIDLTPASILQYL